MTNEDVFLFAAFTGKLQQVQASLLNGIDKDAADKHKQTALYKAASNGHASVAMSLILAGANVNAIESENLSTPLHGAAAGGWTTIAHCLVKNHANLEAVDREDSTPLLVAASCGCLQVAQYLVAAGANINARNGFKRTPAMVAKRNGFCDLARFLKAHGSSIDVEFADDDACLKGNEYPSITEDQSVSTQSDFSESDTEESSDAERVIWAKCALQV